VRSLNLRIIWKERAMSATKRRLYLERLEGRETPSSMVPVQIIDTLGHVAPAQTAVVREMVSVSHTTGATACFSVTTPPPRPGLLLPD
jgi:hypothetical protein